MLQNCRSQSYTDTALFCLYTMQSQVLSPGALEVLGPLVGEGEDALLPRLCHAALRHLGQERGGGHGDQQQYQHWHHHCSHHLHLHFTKWTLGLIWNERNHHPFYPDRFRNPMHRHLVECSQSLLVLLTCFSKRPCRSADAWKFGLVLICKEWLHFTSVLHAWLLWGILTWFWIHIIKVKRNTK